MTDFTALPIVLSIAGHDPSGGAGVQADAETVAALGSHAATVVACLTVQDTRDVHEVLPLPAALVCRQLEAVLGDLAVGAVKVGLLGSAEVVVAVAEALGAHPGVPVVVDPVLAAGGGRELASAALIAAYCHHLLPRATVATPNAVEVCRLAPAQSPADAAETLLDGGCQAVLVTGGHSDDGPLVIDRLYRPGRPPRSFTVPRIAGRFHGTGCTLSSAVAAGLAMGRPLEDAIRVAQAFTHDAVRAAFKAGAGQLLPRRIRP
jgi:hydroxymethylpyrimidine/phosphomethylpyrimidine kinase